MKKKKALSEDESKNHAKGVDGFRTEPTFAFGEIGGGGLAAVLQADVALRSASRTHAPSLALGAGFDYGPYGPSENKNHLA